MNAGTRSDHELSNSFSKRKDTSDHELSNPCEEAGATRNRFTGMKKAHVKRLSFSIGAEYTIFNCPTDKRTTEVRSGESGGCTSKTECLKT